jgi:hypothetical protein
VQPQILLSPESFNFVPTSQDIVILALNSSVSIDLSERKHPRSTAEQLCAHQQRMSMRTPASEAVKMPTSRHEVKKYGLIPLYMKTTAIPCEAGDRCVHNTVPDKKLGRGVGNPRNEGRKFDELNNIQYIPHKIKPSLGNSVSSLNEEVLGRCFF